MLEAAGAATIAGDLRRAFELAEAGRPDRGRPAAVRPARDGGAHADAPRRPAARGPGARARGRARGGAVRPGEGGHVPARVRGHAHDRRHVARDGGDGAARARGHCGRSPRPRVPRDAADRRGLYGGLGETAAGDELGEACEPVLLGDEPVLGPPEVLGMAAHASVWTERFGRAEALFDRLIGSLGGTSAPRARFVYPLAARSHLDFRTGRWPAALAGADESVPASPARRGRSRCSPTASGRSRRSRPASGARMPRASTRTRASRCARPRARPRPRSTAPGRCACSSSGSATSTPPATTGSPPSARSARPRATSPASSATRPT